MSMHRAQFAALGTSSSEHAQLVWLVLYCTSGIALGMTFEVLQLHAGPASYRSAFLPLLGYWGQALAGGCFALRSCAWRRGSWNRRNLTALGLSAIFDGAAQALNFAAQVEGGMMLFTIFNSSVTLFACLIALFLPWTPRLSKQQWLGILLVVSGLMVTSIPNPIVARHSFSLGVLCALAGSLCTAGSYPISELVFRLTPSPPAEEMACFGGALINCLVFSMWTLVYTWPRWDHEIVEPLRSSRDPSVPWAIFGYSMFTALVALHAISFWFSVHRMGTVPTAVSKGAQQSGVFLFAHLLFCNQDPTECLWNNRRSDGSTLWSHWQKSAALVCCCAGVMLYTLGRSSRSRTAKAAETETVSSFLSEIEWYDSDETIAEI